jgi:hypothetical protein
MSDTKTKNVSPGRPKVEESLRKNEKVTISLTVAQLAELTASAKTDLRFSKEPLKLQDWCREVLLRSARNEEIS